MIVPVWVTVLALLQAVCGLDTAGCGSSKNCVRQPIACSQTDPACLFFSYVWDSTNSRFNMELSGGAGNGASYVAVAFSSSGNMQDSELYYCSGSSFQSGVIQARYNPPVIDSTLQSGVSSTSASTVGGVAECVFTRPDIVNKTISGSTVQSFNLLTTQYRILLATSTISSGTLERHTPANRYSIGPFDFTVDPAATTTTPTTTTTTTTTTVTSSTNFADGCAETKTCLTVPDGCSPGTSTCMFASWIFVPATNTFNFQLVGAGTDQYVAIAFSDDQEMQDDDLYYCTSSSVVSGAIQASESPPTPLSSNTIGIANANGGVDGGVLSCTFTRDASVTKQVSGGSNKVFDFSTGRFFVLMARGPFSGGSISYHLSNRGFSASAQNFTAPPSNVGGSGSSSHKRNMVKAHASLMIIAWLTCASIGVLIARHFKPLWHNNDCCGKQVWFQIHRALMITAVVATLLGFILIFSSVEGYSGHAGAHPIIGIIVTILAITNPIMAIFRPHPGTPKRWIFNWGHWFVGSAARILGITAIFLGVDLTSLDLPEWDTWVLVGFVCFHVVFEIILEILSAVYGHISGYKKKKPTNDVSMDDKAEEDKPPRGVGIKYFVLVVYSLGNIAFALTFLATIGQMD